MGVRFRAVGFREPPPYLARRAGDASRRNMACAGALRRKDNYLHVVARWQGKLLNRGGALGASATAHGEAGRRGKVGVGRDM